MDMKVLAISKDLPGADEEQFTEDILRAEAGKVWELYQSGVLREIYFTDTQEAVLILECDDAEEAHSHLAGLPLVHAGLIDFEVKALVPYTGLARLFAPRT